MEKFEKKNYCFYKHLPTKKKGIETRNAPIATIRICDVFLIKFNDLNRFENKLNSNN